MSTSKDDYSTDITMEERQEICLNISIAAADVQSAEQIREHLIDVDAALNPADILTVNRCVHICKERMMDRLKDPNYPGEDSGMDCDDLDLSTDGNAGKRRLSREPGLHQGASPTMKKLKSYQEPSKSSQGCKQNYADESSPLELANVYTIIVKPDPLSCIPSHVFPMCTPGVLVVPFKTSTFRTYKDLVIDTIKEIGEFWKNAAFTYLIMVDTSPRLMDEDSSNEARKVCISSVRGELYETHFDHYIEFCQIEELENKVVELASKFKGLHSHINKTHRTVVEAFNRHPDREPFIEKSKIFSGSEISSDVIRSLNIACVEYQKMDYLYKQENVINAFQRLVRKLPNFQYSLELKELYLVLESLSQSRIYLEAFQKEGLVQVVKEKKLVFFNPLLDSRYIGQLDTIENVDAVSSILRLTVKSDAVPGLLNTNIVGACVARGWQVHSLTGCNFSFEYFLSKDNFRLKLAFRSLDSKCYVYLQMMTIKEIKIDNRVVEESCEIIRQVVEKTVTNFFKSPVERHVADCGQISFVSVEGSKWESVGELLNTETNMYKSGLHLLSHWFASEKQAVEAKFNNAIEVFLSELSNNFGSGYYLFFVEQGIASDTIDIYLEEDRRIDKVIFRLLKDWWKSQESPSVFTLREALRKSNHLKMSTARFDEIATKAFDTQS